MKYRLLVDLEVLHFSLSLPVSQRRRLFIHFEEIQKFPGNYSDFIDSDDQGRLLQVSLFEDFLIRYWIDDADRHIKILYIAQNE